MRAIILALGLLALSHTALAQVNNAYVLPGGCGSGSYPVGTAQPLTVDSTGKNCVNASVSASISGFTPNGNYATLSVPSGSSSVATSLPTGSVVLFQNTGSNTASINLGSGAATANNIQIPANSWIALTVGANTQFTAYGVGGTTSLVLTGGAGLPTGAVAGSGGSGSNASVGSTGAAVPGSATYLGVSNGGTLIGAPGDATNGIWVNVRSLVNPVIAAGSNVIGGVTQSGTWTVQPGNTANTTPWLFSLNDGTNTAKVQGASTSPALADKALTVVNSPNPSPVCTNNIAVNQTASTDLHTMTNFGYICSMTLISATQQGVSISEGTGSTCATGTTYLFGGSGGTAQIAANAGWTLAPGSPIKMNASADHLCLIQSGSGNISGIITYADHT